MKKVDEYERFIVMRDGVKVAIDDIAEIGGEMFGAVE